MGVLLDLPYLMRFLVKNGRGWGRGGYGGFLEGLIENWRMLVGKEFLLKNRGI